MRKAWYIYLIGGTVIAGLFHEGDPVAALFFFAIAGGFWWMYTAPQRKIENAKKLVEDQKRLVHRQETLRQEEVLRKQLELEKSLSEQNVSRCEDLGKMNLRHHVNEILSTVILLPGSEADTKTIFAAINDSINNVLTDPKIVPEYFLEPSIKNDKVIIFAHLEECGMTKHIVAKRLKACLDSIVTRY